MRYRDDFYDRSIDQAATTPSDRAFDADRGNDARYEGGWSGRRDGPPAGRRPDSSWAAWYPYLPMGFGGWFPYAAPFGPVWNQPREWDRRSGPHAGRGPKNVFGVADVDNDLEVRHGLLATLTGERASERDEARAQGR